MYVPLCQPLHRTHPGLSTQFTLGGFLREAPKAASAYLANHTSFPAWCMSFGHADKAHTLSSSRAHTWGRWQLLLSISTPFLKGCSEGSNVHPQAGVLPRVPITSTWPWSTVCTCQSAAA